MARNKAANKQQRRSISKVKNNPFKAKPAKQKGKKVSNEIAETFATMQKQQQKTAMTPGKQTKQGKRKAQENLNRLSDIVEKRRKNPAFSEELQTKPAASSTMTSNSAANVNNNHQHPSLVPNGTANQLKRRSQRNSKPDTIVIDDSDEENEPSPPPLFYVDRNPGIRDEDVPLYVVNDDVAAATNDDAPTVIVDSRPAANLPDDSVIVLDSTLDQTMQNSMKEMQISSVEVVGESVQPSSTETAGGASSSLSSSSTTFSSGKEETENKQSKENGNQAVETIAVSEVIDLSDYPDVEEPSTSTSYAAKLSTPAFPALDRIPLGFSTSKPRAANSSNPQQKKAQNNANGDGEMQTKKRMIVIDGNNVAYGHLNGRMFSVKGLELCINYFKKLGHEVTAVVPQFKLKKHQSTDYVLLEKLHKNGDVTLAPCKSLPGQFSSSYDDRLILSIAEQFDAVIISNDNFRDLLDISKEWRRIIETRVVGYSWVKDCFFLPDDPYGRRGPTLQQILNGNSR